MRAWRVSVPDKSFPLIILIISGTKSRYIWSLTHLARESSQITPCRVMVRSKAILTHYANPRGTGYGLDSIGRFDF